MIFFVAITTVLRRRRVKRIDEEVVDAAMEAAAACRLTDFDDRYDNPYTGHTATGGDGDGDGASGIGVGVPMQRAQRDPDIYESDYPVFEGRAPSSTFPRPSRHPYPPQQQPHPRGFSDGRGREDPFQPEYVPSPSPSLPNPHGLPSPNLPNLDFTYDPYFEDGMGAGRANPGIEHTERVQEGRVGVKGEHADNDNDGQPRLLNVQADSLSFLSSVGFDFNHEVAK